MKAQNLSTGFSWFLLVSPGLCWSLYRSLLVPAGLYRSFLVSAGLSWSLLVSTGLSWQGRQKGEGWGGLGCPLGRPTIRESTD